MRIARLMQGGLVVGLVATPGVAFAGPCDCEHVLEPDDTVFDGAETAVAPGERICVRGGERPFLRLYNLEGTEDAPIEVVNCEGVVDISNDDRGYGISGDGIAHLHLTGTGESDAEYGFRVRASKDGPDYSASGVVFGGLSTNYELDHIEVYETGFAGFSLKTEPRCDGSANLGQFVQHETRVHHNWVHDTGGEGFYLGSTGYGGREYSCDGTPTILYPHEHHGFYIHHNLVEDTGWDGMQVGVTPVGCEVHHNTIRRVGLENEQYQDNALQIGGASSCLVWANRLEDGPTNGMIVLDAADTVITNNVIAGFGAHGIYLNDRDTAEVAGSSYAIAHNTVVGIGEQGIELYASQTAGHRLFNNVVVEVTEQEIAVGADVDWTEGGNLVGDADSIGFVDLGARNFELLPDAAAVDAGVVGVADVVSSDLRGVERDATPDVGAYEWTDGPIPPGDGDGDADADADADGDGDGDGDGAGAEDGDAGCGCGVPGGGPGRNPGAGWRTLLAIGAIGGVRRRRRS